MRHRTQKASFEGATGDQLAARLDKPAGQIRACALFAHCFTCSKDLFAVSQISDALTARGIAVLRFDFTGLGHSGGEFENTNFSSNVEDLKRAAAWMKSELEGPEIMIGHSLGGAATLAAASEIEAVDAVATIAAPYDPAHVEHLFGEKKRVIEQQGEATVTLAGRTFTIQKQFLDDIRTERIGPKIANLKKPLLIFHSPVDNLVGVDNARKIFKAAKHPKSFVSLDKADHLLTDKQDAHFVGSTLATWASRYIEMPAEPKHPPIEGRADRVRVSEADDGRYKNHIAIGPHYLIADEPEEVGGNNAGPDPYDLLTAGLGACTSMTLRMYSERKDWPLDSVLVELEHDKIHASDCDDCEQDKGKIDRIDRAISLEGDLTTEQKERLLQIADKCPVHRTLHRSNKVVTRLEEDE